jgi:hypothetical protein
LPNATNTSEHTELPGIRERLDAAMDAKKQIFVMKAVRMVIVLAKSPPYIGCRRKKARWKSFAISSNCKRKLSLLTK